MIQLVDVSKTMKNLPKSVSKRTNERHGCYFGGILSESDGKSIQIMLWHPDQTYKFRIEGYKELRHYYFKSEADAQKVLDWHKSL